MESVLFKLNKWITISAVLVAVIFLIGGCALANHPPSINSLEAKQDVISPLDSCLIECVASDEDGDELSYEWSASEGKINGNGATVAWSAPKYEGVYNIMVKVTDGNGGKASGSVTITVKNNHIPAINGLTTNRDWLNPSGSCEVKCEAEDPDGDELNYEWLASGGEISGTGSLVTWTAPDATGLYDIAVVVTDGYGGEDTRSLPISVSPIPPPVIEELSVTFEDPKYMREYSWGYTIFRGKSCGIECIVTDASDELVYEWSADEGKISGEGSVVTWTAHSGSGEVIVTVTVSDVVGLKTTKNVVFKVLAPHFIPQVRLRFSPPRNPLPSGLPGLQLCSLYRWLQAHSLDLPEHENDRYEYYLSSPSSKDFRNTSGILGT